MTISEPELLILRKMTPAEKLEVMRGLIRQAYELKAAAVKARHPELPEEDVEAETRRLVAGGIP